MSVEGWSFTLPDEWADLVKLNQDFDPNKKPVVVKFEDPDLISKYPELADFFSGVKWDSRFQLGDLKKELSIKNNEAELDFWKLVLTDFFITSDNDLLHLNEESINAWIEYETSLKSWSEMDYNEVDITWYWEKVRAENNLRYGPNWRIIKFSVIDVNDEEALVWHFYKEVLDHGIPEKVKNLLPLILKSEDIEFTDESWDRLRLFILFLMSVESAKATDFTNGEWSSAKTEFQIMFSGWERWTFDWDSSTKFQTIAMNLRRTFEYWNRGKGMTESNTSDFHWKVKQFENLKEVPLELLEWLRDMWVISVSNDPRDFLFEDLMLISILGILFDSWNQGKRKQAMLWILSWIWDFEDNMRKAYGYHHGNPNSSTERAIGNNVLDFAP